MINTLVNLIGFNDPTVHRIHEKYGIFSAKLWNISNIAFRISLFNLIIGAVLLLTHFIIISNEIMFLTGIIFLFIAQFLFWIGQLAIIIYQILRKDYLWAIGSFFLFIIIFIYKWVKKNEL